MAEINRDTVLRALTRHAGNKSAAARELGMPRVALGAFIKANIDLLEAAIEIEERRLDQAEAALKRALRHGSLEQRMKAATLVVRMSRRLHR